EHTFGVMGYLFKDLRIPRGELLSGWVAANRQPIINSDPMLDLGEVARAMSPPLRASLSTPAEARGEVLAVLTLYSSAESFKPEDLKIVEAAGRCVAEALGRSIHNLVVRS